MAFSSFEILVLIFAIVTFVKLTVILVNAKAWMSFVKKLYSKPNALMFVELILATIVIYYLLWELTIVQIMACVVLGALLTGMTFAAYAKEILPMVQKMLKSGVLRKAWLPLLVWMALIVWGILVLLNLI